MEKGEQLRKLVSGGSQEVLLVLYVDFYSFGFDLVELKLQGQL